mgnify:FL=1
MGLLVLIRHGQSLWNAENRFTGWVDIELSEKGMNEAKSAGEKLSKIEFDAVYASGLVRAQRTAEIILDINHSWSGEVIHDSRLNERNYGDLQGRNKQECREEFGEEQVKKWRRSYEGIPPGGESLRMTSERTLPCLFEQIVPNLESGETVLVAAHGNSLRSLVMEIEGLGPDEIVKREIPTGVPMAYRYESGLWEAIQIT